MEMNTVKQYYDDLTSVSIESVANHLLSQRITAQQGNTIFCDCPNHGSQSKRSLHISTDKQMWHCFGCAVGGDVLNLVEFVNDGIVSTGKTITDTHRAARDWLARFANLPSLSSLAISAERQKQGEASVQQVKHTGEVMRQIFMYYHVHFLAESNAEILSWFKKNYAIADKTAKRLLIGYMPVENQKVITGKLELFLGKRGITPTDILSTGLFRVGKNDELIQSFPGRILLPYWSKGKPRFCIARKTPATPNNEYEQGKYKKLPTHDDHRYSHICESIDNRLLYNEDVLSSNPAEVIITEGITDCMVLEQAGFTSISPVTVSISSKDWDRIIPKLRNVQTVYLCLDNEVSGVGLKGAKKAATKLGEQNIDARVITIPLGDKQRDAREKLLVRYGIKDSGLTSKEKKKVIESFNGNVEKIEDFEQLSHDSKSDPNEYFQSGGTIDKFNVARDEAKTIVDFEIDIAHAFYLANSEAILAENEKIINILNEYVERLMLTLATMTPIVQEQKIKKISLFFNGMFSKKALSAQLVEAKSQLKTKKEKTDTPLADRLASTLGEGSDGVSGGGDGSGGTVGTSGDSSSTGGDSGGGVFGGISGGTCLAAIKEAEAKARTANQTYNAVMMAETIADWIEGNGGKFFYYPNNESCLFFDNNFYHMDSSAKGDRRKFRQFLYRLTGLVDTTSDGRTVIETLANTAHRRGVLRKQLTWLHTDTQNYTAYFAHDCESSHILKIGPNSVEEIKNGVNDDEVLLSTTEKIIPFNFNPDVSIEDAVKVLQNEIQPAMACDEQDAKFIVLWCSCFLLIDFVSTRPATRFEGDSASGKSTAAKIITTLLYGKEQQKRSTDAANYYDGANNPLVCLDNIETKQMTDGLTQFILTSVTGISNEKRQMGSDSGVVSETSKCLVNTTGIEALCGGLSEIQNRTLTFNFSAKYHDSKKAFVEVELLNRIKQHRDLLLSAMIIVTSKVLHQLKTGALSKTIEGIFSTVGKHEKSRCNEYLSLMALVDGGYNGTLDKPHDTKSIITGKFCEAISRIEDTSRSTSTDTNPIAHAIDMVLSAFETTIINNGVHARAEMEAKTGVKYYYIEQAIKGATAKQLYVAFSKMFKEAGMQWTYSNPRVLAQRIVNDKETIIDAGFILKSGRKSKNHSVEYTISRREQNENMTSAVNGEDQKDY